MTTLIKIAYRNILENSTVTTTNENASFPKYRLSDRDIGKLFKFSAASNPSRITIDQGAATQYPASRLFIPAGHNLNGLTVTLQYSTDNFAADNHDAVQWAQAGAGLIDKAFTEQTKRYWRLNIAAPGAPCELAEMFLTKPYEFPRNPSWGFGTGNRLNVLRDETLSGKVRLIKNGAPRKERTYDLTRIQSAQKTEMETWESVSEGIRAIYIEDESAAVFFAEVLGAFKFRNEREGRWGLPLQVLEFL